MHDLRINLKKHNKSSVKVIFKQYQLESILWGLWQLKDSFNSIEIAYTTSVAIEFAKPGRYDNTIKHLEKSVLMNLVKLATDFCLNISGNVKNSSGETHDIFYTIFNLMANQFSLSSSYYGDFARALLLYKIIPNEIKTKKFKYPLTYEFKKDKGYSIDDYLLVCFIAAAAINSKGKFSDDYFDKVTTVSKSPDFETMNAILTDISASAIHYRRERKKLNSLNSFKYHPLLMYPLIKPWSHIPKHIKGKRYLSPLPDLIGHKANIGIYHHFLSKYKTKFTTFFGKEVFERYVGQALNSCCFGDKFKDEDKITTDYKIASGVSIPDFLLIRENRGIIIECKAAVLPLRVYTEGNMTDFKTTVNKIHTGVCQITSFEKYALDNSLYNVNEWFRLIITYEPLWGINSGILPEILITDFKDEDEALKFRDGFDKVLILSVSQLDTIQTYTSERNSLHSILKKIKNSDFNNVINNLIDKTGRTFKDSYLAKYTEQITKRLVPE